MKKNKKKIINIIILFLIIVPLVSYKIFVYKSYGIIMDEEKEMINEVKKPIENAKNVHITHKDYDGEYLIYKNIKIANKFDNLLLKSKNNNSDTYQSTNDDIYVTIGTSIHDIEALKSIKNDCNLCGNKIKQIIRDNKIVSNVDVYKYIKEYRFGKSSFLTSISKTKEDYIVKDYLLSYLPSISEFIFIEGDYQGYISSFNSSSSEKLKRYEAVLEKNNESYFVQVMSVEGSITLDEFYELISTTVIM